MAPPPARPPPEAGRKAPPARPVRRPPRPPTAADVDALLDADPDFAKRCRDEDTTTSSSPPSAGGPPVWRARRNRRHRRRIAAPPAGGGDGVVPAAQYSMMPPKTPPPPPPPPPPPYVGPFVVYRPLVHRQGFRRFFFAVGGLLAPTCLLLRLLLLGGQVTPTRGDGLAAVLPDATPYHPPVPLSYDAPCYILSSPFLTDVCDPSTMGW
eukprot:gene7510-6868_t